MFKDIFMQNTWLSRKLTNLAHAHFKLSGCQSRKAGCRLSDQRSPLSCILSPTVPNTREITPQEEKPAVFPKSFMGKGQMWRSD